MDATLLCNKPNGACRTPLVDRAVVTTCCHIFCLRCADELGLTRATAETRACPACSQHLPNTDDAVTTMLQPSEDYKTSVLSGLDPTTIMECAGRALSFWSYQSAQEIAYQEHLGKIMTDKYTHLSRGMDKVINDANMEIQGLQTRVMTFGVDYKTLQQKNTDLVELYKEKNRKHQQTQHMYDVLKKRVMMGQVHTAASENANHTLQSINAGKRPETVDGMQNMNTHGVLGNLNLPSRSAQFESGVEQLHTHQRSGSACHDGSEVITMLPPQMIPKHRPQNMPGTTPMHRAPLGQPIGPTRNHRNRSQIPTTTHRPSQSYNGHPSSLQQTSASVSRQQSAHPSGRSTSGNYGIQAGMKMGAVPGGGTFIQRPASHAGDASAGNGSQVGVYDRGQQYGTYFH